MVIGCLALIVIAWWVPIAGQGGAATATAPAAKNWKVSRTPWGHPDLQGIWNNGTTTPLARLLGVNAVPPTRGRIVRYKSGASCITVPPFPTGYNNNYQIVQTPEHVPFGTK